MPKRVLHLSSESSWRGGERQIAYLMEESRLAGLEVLVAGKKKSAFEEWCVDENFEFLGLPFRNGLDFATAWSIRRIARDRGVDLIHTHSGQSLSIAYWASLLGMNAPIVVHRRVDFPLKSGGFSLKKYTFEGVKAIICVSRFIEEMVRDKVGDTKIIKTVYSGIDFSGFRDDPSSGYLHRELNIDPNKKLIANISALAPHKDYPTFLKTAKRVLANRNDCHFLIVGEGSLREKLEIQANELGISTGLTFTGFRKDVPEIFRELTVFLITSETEGLGTTIIDAMYNEIPVVATEGGGIPELVVEGKTGFLCPVRDDGCLAQRVEELLDNSSMVKAMGKEARLRAQGFSKKEMAQRIFEIYDEVSS